MEEFKRLDHTRHGLHLNKLGKTKLANAIVHNVTIWYGRSQVNQVSSSPDMYASDCSQGGERLNEISLIEVVNTHMDYLTEKT